MVVQPALTFFDYLSVFLAAVSGLISVLAPIVSFCIIQKLKKSKSLHKNESKQKYGELYQDFLRGHDTEMNKLLYNVFWMVRRIISVICFFFLTQTPSLQIGILM
jgi:hypothetical protein